MWDQGEVALQCCHIVPVRSFYLSGLLFLWLCLCLFLSLRVSLPCCLHLSVSASFFFCLSGFLLVSVSLCLCLTTHHPQPPALCSATPNYWKLPRSATFFHRHGCCVTHFSPFQEHRYLWPLPKFLPALFILRSEFKCHLIL